MTRACDYKANFTKRRNTRSIRSSRQAAAHAIRERICGLTFASALFDPALERRIRRLFQIQEFHAHANPGLYGANDTKRFDSLLFPGHGDAYARFQREGFAGADKAAAKRKV